MWKLGIIILICVLIFLTKDLWLKPFRKKDGGDSGYDKPAKKKKEKKIKKEKASLKDRVSIPKAKKQVGTDTMMTSAPYDDTFLGYPKDNNNAAADFQNDFANDFQSDFANEFENDYRDPSKDTIIERRDTVIDMQPLDEEKINYLVETSTGKKVPIVGEIAYAGRNRSNDMQLNTNDMHIHGENHFRILVKDGKAELKCLKENGITYNGEKCHSAALSDGDTFKVGDTEYRVELNEASGNGGPDDSEFPQEEDYSQDPFLQMFYPGEIGRDAAKKEDKLMGADDLPEFTYSEEEGIRINERKEEPKHVSNDETMIFKKSDFEEAAGGPVIEIILKDKTGKKHLEFTPEEACGKIFGRGDFPDVDNTAVSRKLFTIEESYGQYKVKYLPSVGSMDSNGMSVNSMILQPGTNEFRVPTASFEINYRK